MSMTGYTKLFGAIITSTIWREKKETKILWITMLALKDKRGIVEGSVPGLADMARLSIDETRAALKILSAPDEFSRSKEFEGRRIEEIDGGWLILNHKKWRDKMNEDERREYFRLKQREHRAKVKLSVNKRRQMSTPSTQSESYTYTETKKDVGANGSRPASDVWLSQLAKDPTYEGIDVTREFGKMQNWCKIHGKQPTERRFINWLNRTDRPVKPPKPASPVYGRNPLPPAHELSEEERQRHREIARRAKEQLSKKLSKSF